MMIVMMMMKVVIMVITVNEYKRTIFTMKRNCSNCLYEVVVYSIMKD